MSEAGTQRSRFVVRDRHRSPCSGPQPSALWALMPVAAPRRSVRLRSRSGISLGAHRERARCAHHRSCRRRARDRAAPETWSRVDVISPKRKAIPISRGSRRYLFSTESPPERKPTGELVWFSAPGEGRECVEVARRMLKEAGNGVRFDEMAILIRSPQQYIGVLEHALGRAEIPAYLDRGIRRPHPAGRAFLAILSCAVENLSAKRFAEYLSLGQVPALIRTKMHPTPFSHRATRSSACSPKETAKTGTAVPTRTECRRSRTPDADRRLRRSSPARSAPHGNGRAC